MASLIDILGEIPDPRQGNAQRHDLLDILTIALVASICGAESCLDFAEFAKDREPLLREFLSLENGLLSHDTFSRVFRLLDPAAFGRVFAAFLDDLGAAGAGVLAIDGKTLRRPLILLSNRILSARLGRARWPDAPAVRRATSGCRCRPCPWCIRRGR